MNQRKGAVCGPERTITIGRLMGVAELAESLKAHYDAELARQRISDVLAIIPQYGSLGVKAQGSRDPVVC